MSEGGRVCAVEGCTNLGKSQGSRRPRNPLCTGCQRERWPAVRESHRAHTRARQADGRFAAPYAAQLLRGEQVRDYPHHHAGVRHLLGLTKGDGLTASRTCSDDCPESWLGWKSGTKVEYRLCKPAHYVAESQAANAARKGSS